MASPLESFLPATQRWFAATFGEPTPPQLAGWPAIQRGEHTLILSPTGSGKTLAAFLWGIDALFREVSAQSAEVVASPTPRQRRKGAPRPPNTLRLLYISPLKALNNDIERNLRVPLAGIRQAAQELGTPLPPLTVAVRTGDTPASARAAMLRHPPHILITTPESLYLLLTSPVARTLFRQVRTVIVDEIHTLAGSKRGVHLALSLERLERLTGVPPQRIGLSATIQPLSEAAAFLGGQTWRRDPTAASADPSSDSALVCSPRPVTIVDAAHRKALDLQVQSRVDDFRHMIGDSVWPAVIPYLTQLIREHRTTLIFCNSRLQAERVASRLNQQLAAEAEGRIQPGQSAMLVSDPRGGEVAPGRGMFAASAQVGGPIRAHHGSMSREARQQMEEQLKRGELPALVGTSSLELGIDIGSIDLVVQIGSPKSVAQALQRIGRSGHLVGQTSVGRILPLHREDLMEAAAIARGMLRGEVEPVHTPRTPLDVLAQQIVAMTSVEPWDVDELYTLVRQAYPYRGLSRAAFLAVLEMLAGKYPSTVHRELRPRLVWDRVHNSLSALPASRLLALRNGGVIADRGTFGAYLPDGRTRLGELDEEFVFETRPGDVFTLGSHVWRVLEITDDRVIVGDAAGEIPRMPFWRGDYPWRPYALGRRVGEFRRELAARVAAVRTEPAPPSEESDPLEEGDWLEPYAEVVAWLQRECALDRAAARNLIAYVRHQLDVIGAIPSDRTIIVESFADALGEPRILIHSPFGGQVNGPWGLALASALRERSQVEVELQTSDDGILIRFPGADQPPPFDLARALTPAEARERILRDLPYSAVFGAQFRQNAARALLLPGAKGRRTPFWLQRLKAKDLLAAVRQFEDFPIVVETYRDCLRDVMDLSGLEEVLTGVQDGRIEIVVKETITPSPVAMSLLNQFIAIYMYDKDTPKAEQHLRRLAVSRELLADLLSDSEIARLLRPEAIAEVAARAQRVDDATRARSRDELMLLLEEMGDLTTSEVAARAQPGWEQWLADLAAQGRVLEIDIPAGASCERRWIAAEAYPRYRDAFALPARPPIPIPTPLLAERWPLDQARLRILNDLLRHSGPLSREQIIARYAFPDAWLDAALADLATRREVAVGRFAGADAPAAPVQYLHTDTLAQIHRRTLSLLRREVQPVSLFAFADFLARWQHLHPTTRLTGRDGLVRILQQLRAMPIVGAIWEQDLLPLRLTRYLPADLDALCQSGELVWMVSGAADPRRARVRFLFRGEGGLFLPEALTEPDDLDELARQALAFLREEGACFAADLQEALQCDAAQVERALVALAMAGLITNDSLQALRALLARGQTDSAPRQPLSALEADLAAWRAQRRAALARPRGAALREAKRRVVRRLEEQAEPVAWAGRWSPVHRLRVMGKPVAPEERIERQARQLLSRWGVVTRNLVQAEGAGWEWDALYACLQLLEMRGEVRRGYFVSGLAGAQFALPEAVEQLRALRSQTVEQETESVPVVMNACDPANLFGSERLDASTGVEAAELRSGVGSFARLPSTHIVLWRGQPTLLALGEGRSLRADPQASAAVVRRCLEELLNHLVTRGEAAWGRRVYVEQWDGEPVLGSRGQALLEEVGFYRDPPGMSWESQR